ncbi:radical SAM protein [Hymenobacter arizonensis]|uniref:Radical SAM core domain-containing protein n=1 Tax=Hymenobacter arizonensis TaxID=1227077 RepID=A0A1I6BGL3_HYMAR|nr:radical SAM protein [Hymenobacter arizonensis]SFQ80078.1 uncharacterized protein SAMN04515668_4536 [Hymenobacter arizonensis]
MELSGIVLKIASRCNLNCSYCYMYNKGDQSYKAQPKVMSKETMVKVVDRIEEYCLANNKSDFLIIFHGGEPLLADKALFRYFVNECHKRTSVAFDFILQTNGVLVDEEWCSLFKELNIDAGFSLDGTRALHDVYRLYHSGKGSYDDVIQGLQTYKRHFPANLTVITVMNVDNNPIEIYESYKSLGINKWNILPPDFTHDTKPAWLKNPYETPWADKIITLFEHWLADQSDSKVRIDIFEIMIALIIGIEEAGNDHFGMRENGVLVIETNGGIEATDPMKACGHNFTKEGMSVYTNTLAQAMKTPLAIMYSEGHQRLCQECQVCPVKQVCGGGYVVHRFRQENLFDNRSVYCSDLLKMITYIQNRIRILDPSLSEHLPALDFEEILARINKDMVPNNDSFISILN